MRPGFDLPPLAFTSEEIEAIVVGLALLKRTGDVGLQNAAEQVAQKIDAVLPEDANSTIDNSGLEVSSWMGATPSGNVMSKLRQAIREEAQLEITYSDANGEVTKRKVKPLAVIYYIEVELLAAWCDLRADFRHFRVDRIVGLTDTNKEFSDEMPQLRSSWLEKRKTANSELM
ncbi:MAG: transcriptional regulator [Blastopirellula sp.]|nr:MAG: transcriptional regulator [Blastopirellula sp.]